MEDPFYLTVFVFRSYFLLKPLLILCDTLNYTDVTPEGKEPRSLY